MLNCTSWLIAALLLGPAEPDAQPSSPKPAPSDPIARPSEADDGLRLPATAPARHRTGMRLGLVLPPKPWPRRRGWAAARITLGGAIGGQPRAAATVVALSGGVEAGWRIHNVVAIGLGIYRQPHSIRTTGEDIGIERFSDRGHLTSYDLLILRGYVPIDFTLQPYIDVAGGLVTVEPSLSTAPVLTGGQARVGLGADAWLLPKLSIGFGLLYRFVYVQRSVGHGLQGFFEIGFHW